MMPASKGSRLPLALPESWTPPVEAPFSRDKLIKDFSYAGYRRGEEAIPQIAGPVFDVKQRPFAADSTGRVDATSALLSTDL